MARNEVKHLPREVDAIITVDNVISGIRLKGKKDKTKSVVIPIQRVFQYIDAGYDFFIRKGNATTYIIVRDYANGQRSLTTIPDKNTRNNLGELKRIEQE